jgi:hypothetical protein
VIVRLVEHQHVNVAAASTRRAARIGEHVIAGRGRSIPRCADRREETACRGGDGTDQQRDEDAHAKAAAEEARQGLERGDRDGR